MKPAAFEYFRPATLAEALSVLGDHQDGAKPLAGGQSLVPAMNFRIAQPAVLVDLNRIAALSLIERTPEGGLRIGAMARHAALEKSKVVRDVAPLIADAMPFVAHLPIRARGTIGGSLAHADPAAELPAVMLAEDAGIVLQSRAGTRVVPATEFFVGLYATALEPGELIVAVAVPPPAPRSGWAIDEVARRHGDFALAGVAARVTLDEGGSIATARIALFGVHETPVLASHAAAVLAGARPTDETFRAAAAAAGQHDADPSADIHASAAYRRHLTEVLTRRVLAQACARALAGGRAPMA